MNYFTTKRDAEQVENSSKCSTKLILGNNINVAFLGNSTTIVLGR